MNYSDYDTLTIDGLTLKGTALTGFCQRSTHENIRQMGNFLREWLNKSNYVEVKTSGSTGTPKTISVAKAQMLQSAALTAQFFQFSASQSALLCLPIQYIAGKMMVVRALYSRLHLICIDPDSAPFSHLGDDVIIDFAPLIPMQLKDVQDTKSVKKILLGGSAISPAMENSLQFLKADIYHGYGMTETLSHVALRRVNGPGRSEIYKSLPGIYFDVDQRSCLTLDVPFLDEPVETNDVVELINEHEFIWRGRFDNVVNSGGIKFFPEEIEKKIYSIIPERFFIAGFPDERFGEKLCLLIEGEKFPGDRFDQLVNKLEESLEKYERPKEIFFVKNFRLTSSGKIMRKATLEIILPGEFL